MIAMTPTNAPLRYAFVVLTTPDGSLTRFELTFADGELDENGLVKMPVPASTQFNSVPSLLRWLADNCEAVDASQQ